MYDLLGKGSRVDSVDGDFWGWEFNDLHQVP